MEKIITTTFKTPSHFRQWELENSDGQTTAVSMNHTGHETALLAAMVSSLQQ
jgi:hypothetical protein